MKPTGDATYNQTISHEADDRCSGEANLILERCEIKRARTNVFLLEHV